MSSRVESLALLTAALALAPFSRPASAQTPTAAGVIEPKAAFDRLKSLAGAWEGRVADEAAGPATTVFYRVASNGSVVMETLFPGTEHEMISMYHMEKEDLVLTHYCAMANQPKMRLDPKASTMETLVFAFEGGTNFDPAKDPHVHSGVVSFRGEALQADWAVWYDGKEASHNRFFLTRRKK